MVEGSGLSALSSDEVDWESLLPDLWIAVHPEYVLTYRRDEADAAGERASSPSGATPGERPGTPPKPLRSPRCRLGCGRPTAEEPAHPRTGIAWGFTERTSVRAAVHQTPLSPSRR
jgi:hypothetical protein